MSPNIAVDSSRSLGCRNCIAVGRSREETVQVREKRGLPGCRSGESERRVSEAPLAFTDQVVQQADEPQCRLGRGGENEEE